MAQASAQDEWRASDRNGGTHKHSCCHARRHTDTHTHTHTHTHTGAQTHTHTHRIHLKKANNLTLPAVPVGVPLTRWVTHTHTHTHTEDGRNKSDAQTFNTSSHKTLLYRFQTLPLPSPHYLYAHVHRLSEAVHRVSVGLDVAHTQGSHLHGDTHTHTHTHTQI